MTLLLLWCCLIFRRISSKARSMEESVGTLANVAQCTQQLRQCSLSVEENAISGDLPSVISSLVQSLHYCSSPDQTAHTLGALASTLTVYDIEAESTKASDPPIVIEQTLANQLKPPLSFLVQERTKQALARFYGNSFLSDKLAHSEAKMMLLWLITMETNRVQDAFVRALLALCSSEGNLWCALQGREGVQLLISLLRPSYGPHQEYVVGLLSLLSNENDESNSAITAAGGIPALVDLLKLIPDHHVTPFLALGLLTQLAKDCPDNMIVMAKCGALEALIKYLSLGPQDAAEEAATDLLGLLFSSNVITRHESALGAVSQLIAVLQRGGRRARCSAANALKLLFLEPSIRNKPEIRQGVQPLWEILNTGSEEEQHAAIAALASSVDKVWSWPYVEKVRKESVDVLCRVLSSNCSMEVKRDAAEICCTLFRNTKMKSTASAACCVDPLVSLLVSEFGPCHLPAINALDELVEDNEKLAEIVVVGGVVVSLTGLLLEGKDYVLHAAVCGLLEKLGKLVPACREEMAKAGVIERLDEICKRWPFYLIGEDKCSKLMSLLTNNKRGLKRKKIRERRKLYQPPTKKKGIARKC